MSENKERDREKERLRIRLEEIQTAEENEAQAMTGADLLEKQGLAEAAVMLRATVKDDQRRAYEKEKLQKRLDEISEEETTESEALAAADLVDERGMQRAAAILRESAKSKKKKKMVWDDQVQAYVFRKG